MGYRVRMLAVGAAAMLLGSAQAAAAGSYLFWKKPDFSGAPVKGDEPGIILPLPGATEKEIRAGLIWSLRSGLNVAALKCQFAPLLATVPNYNGMLTQHAKELNEAYVLVQGYFKRTGGKTWQKSFDQYTTRTYNGFSTFNGEQGFCDTAAIIGRDILGQKRGDLYLIAQNRMRELRNSLEPARDGIYMLPLPVLAARSLPSLDKICWDKKGQFNQRKCGIPAPIGSVNQAAPALAVDNKALSPGI
jgi:hypothetical protein